MQSFSELGVPARIVRGLLRAGHRHPVPDPAARAPRMPSPAVAKAPRSSGRHQLRDPARRAPRARRCAARRARSRDPTRASLPPRSRSKWPRSRRRASRSRRSTEASHPPPRRSAPDAHTSSSRPPVADQLLQPQSRSTASRRWCSTRPTGCSTWASSLRSTASCRRLPRDPQTMFFSATLDESVGELADAYTSNPVRCAEPRPSTGPARWWSTDSSR